MHLLRCLVGAGILFTAAAESPVALKPNQIYTLSNTCDEYRARLDALVSDVLGMAHDSSTALDDLLTYDFKKLPPPQNIKDAFGAAYWVWGVEPPWAARKFTDAERSRMQKAKDNFDLVVAALSKAKRGTEDINIKANYLYCDTTNLDYVKKVIEISPDDKGCEDVTFRELWLKQVPPHKGIGLWRDKEHMYRDPTTGKNRYVDLMDPFLQNDIADGWVDIDDPEPDYGGHGCCASTKDKSFADGLTVSIAPQRMVLCPKIWNPTEKLQSMKDLRTSTEERAWGEVNSVQGTFLHELMHWIPASPHITDETVFKDGQESSGYGWAAAYRMAGRDPKNPQPAGSVEETVTNADSYFVFAFKIWCPGVRLVTLPGE